MKYYRLVSMLPVMQKCRKQCANGSAPSDTKKFSQVAKPPSQIPIPASYQSSWRHD